MQQRSKRPGEGGEFLVAGIQAHLLSIPRCGLAFGKEERLHLPRRPIGHSRQRELAFAGVGRRAQSQWSGLWAARDKC